MKKGTKSLAVVSLLLGPIAFSSVDAGSYKLKAKDGNPKGQIKLEKDTNFGYWKGTGSGASWTINVQTPGTGTIFAQIAVPNKRLGGDLKAVIDDEEIAVVPVSFTGSWTKYKYFRLGKVDFTKGKHTITVTNESINGEWFANMKCLKIRTKDAKMRVVTAD